MRVLGPVQAVTTFGLPLDLPSASQRRLVALLATEAPRSLRADWICQALAVSPSALRTTVSRVRRAAGDGAIAGAPGRYQLAVPVDAALFTSALAGVGSQADRIEALERTLAMWTGPPFDEFSAESWARADVVRLTELHASAVEAHATELIDAHRWAEAVAGLQAHVAVYPLRDRPRGLLLQALAGAGRQADALGAFRDYRDYLAESVGTEPSAEVRHLDRRVASGWDGVGAAAREDSGASRGARHPARWLPLSAELACGPRLIGRGRELARLVSDLALVGGTGARVVILEGEAGIGKTSLLGGFARAVRDSGSALVLYGSCQGGPAEPLEPFRSLLEHLVESDDAAARHLKSEAVAGLLRRLTGASSVAVLLDDLQWAGPAALDLLRHLGRALSDAPVLWVLAARDTDGRRPAALAPVLADLERSPSRRMLLTGLGDDELADLTASLVEVDRAAVTPALSARLREQTAGNPLYATQLVRHWAESGRLVLDAHVGLGGGESAEEVPASLRDLLWSRVTALGSDVVEVLSAASVLGTEFAEDAVIGMVEIGERAAMDALDRAEQARLVVDVGPQPAAMRFVHALVAGAVYSELPGRRRRRLHARAARVLEQRPGTPSADLPVQLARHCALGGLPAEALRWARLAGREVAVGELRR